MAFMMLVFQSHALAESQTAAFVVPAVIMEPHVETVTIASKT